VDQRVVTWINLAAQHLETAARRNLRLVIAQAESFASKIGGPGEVDSLLELMLRDQLEARASEDQPD
jgi:hypothetical protein